MRRGRNLGFRRALALMALAPALVSTASAMPCCIGNFRLTPELVSVIQEQFAAVPALGIAAAVPDASCSTHSLATSVELLALIAATCGTSVICKNGNHFFFQLLSDGRVLAPRGLDHLLAEECPESITDPKRRDALVKEYEDELQRLGAWLHDGLEK
jgi:hypothetical protein